MNMLDEPICQVIHQLMTLKHDARELKLLNAGTDHSGEHHWRFKTPSGQIIVLQIEVESDGALTR